MNTDLINAFPELTGHIPTYNPSPKSPALLPTRSNPVREDQVFDINHFIEDQQQPRQQILAGAEKSMYEDRNAVCSHFGFLFSISPFPGFVDPRASVPEAEEQVTPSTSI